MLLFFLSDTSLWYSALCLELLGFIKKFQELAHALSKTLQCYRELRWGTVRRQTEPHLCYRLWTSTEMFNSIAPEAGKPEKAGDGPEGGLQGNG